VLRETQPSAGAMEEEPETTVPTLSWPLGSKERSVLRLLSAY
jgi:hypothetical protein